MERMKKFSCFGRKKKRSSPSSSGYNAGSDDDYHNANHPNSSDETSHKLSTEESVVASCSVPNPRDRTYSHDAKPHNAILFSYRELAQATNDFSPEYRIGEGHVHKGQLVSTGQQIVGVAVKRLYPDHGNLQDFISEILRLALLRHPNLVDLIGFCADEDQHILVNDFVSLRSLHFHLHDSTSAEVLPMVWDTRMRIACGVAKALAYLHEQPDGPVIYMDLKSDNILLDKVYHPKLSGFGLSKFGSGEGKRHGSTRFISTSGYCAPEYHQSGVDYKTDVYSFGVLLLELITGKLVYDNTREDGTRYLVEWVEHMLRENNWDPVFLIDLWLVGQCCDKTFRRVARLALMCVQEIQYRSRMVDVVAVLEDVISQTVPDQHLGEGLSSTSGDMISSSTCTTPDQLLEELMIVFDTWTSS